MNEQYKEVTKAEFDQWVASYRKELERSAVQICEPPMVFYRDLSMASSAELGSASYFFDKVVAKIDCDWLGPEGQVDKENTRQYWRYYIKELK